ncbi:hypothetical protein COCNU_scaffold000525G000060 [Cocos nucifera]|nr:hypothetical protein [Cocos nucifera]
MEPFVADGVLLLDIIKYYIERHQFIIAGKVIIFNAKKVILIVDLPYHEMKISVIRKYPKKKERLFDRFEKSLKLQYKGLETLIDQLKSLKRKEDIEDTVRLWIAYMFTFFLAPKSNQTYLRDVIPFLDDLSQLGSFAWAIFIKNLVVEVLPDIADYLWSGELCKAKRVDKRRRQPTLLCCSAVLMVCFLEHTNIRAPSDPLIFLRLLRWHDCKKRSHNQNFDIHPYEVEDAIQPAPQEHWLLSSFEKKKESTHSTDDAKLEEPILVGCAMYAQLRIEIKDLRKKGPHS